VKGHQPESLDWFNVLIAQTIAQLRAEARQDDAILTSLTEVLNTGSKPDWIGDINVTEIALGDEFPIFSNCRVMPAEDGFWYGPGSTGNEKERLQARMDVDLSDVITIGVETTLNLNWPKPKSAVLPVALAISIVRFSGTLAVSFIPSSSPPSTAAPAPSPTATSHPTGTSHRGSSPNRPTSSSGTTPHRPTTLAFTFLDDYRLDLSVRSLVGSRSRLQDVPKIAQLIESRVHAWFDERAVEPRFQQIVLPSLWPRKHNTRGGDADAAAEDGEEDLDDEFAIVDGNGTAPHTTSYIPEPIAENATLEERIEAEGAKMREAEVRAGVRKPSATERPRGREQSTEGMRRRGEQRGKTTGVARPKMQSRTATGIAGGMPGAMPR
jgi:maintenance of morphology protein 1